MESGMNNNLEKLKQKKLFLFDIDGTLAIGDTLYPGSADLLSYIDSIGGKAYYITNNSTKSGLDYVTKFRNAFQLETTEDQFVTSGYDHSFSEGTFLRQKNFCTWNSFLCSRA